MLGQSLQAREDMLAFELKGSTFALPVLKLLNTDLEAISRELAEKLDKAPEFFQNAPVVIDLQAISGQDSATNFALLVGLLRSNGLIPVGVRGGDMGQNEIATSLELAVLSKGTPRRQARPAGQNAASPMGRSKLVTQPVRSGQRVYASGGDLVVLAQVSSGAEVFADGNIHVYGTLRGRALAGVKGDTQARIFCQSLEAELVSIAGHYRVSDDLDDARRGQPAQLYLEKRHLRIAAL